MEAKRGTDWQDLLGTVAFIHLQSGGATQNPNPIGPAHVPAPLLQMQAAADTAPARPAAAAQRLASSLGYVRGNAPSQPNTLHGSPGGRRLSRKGGAAPPRGNACHRQPGPGKKAPPVRRGARSEGIQPSPCRGQRQLAPLSKEPPALRRQQKPLGMKHTAAGKG